jgi:hypothetical protein
MTSPLELPCYELGTLSWSGTTNPPSAHAKTHENPHQQQIAIHVEDEAAAYDLIGTHTLLFRPSERRTSLYFLSRNPAELAERMQFSGYIMQKLDARLMNIGSLCKWGSSRSLLSPKINN